MVKTYSYKKDGDKKLSKNFCVKEFKAHNGDKITTDVIKIDTNLIKKLDKLAKYVDSIIIVDGYRDKETSKLLGGGGDDAHTRGIACDVILKIGNDNIKSEYIACLGQLVGFNGIGIMNGSCHLDIRNSKNYKNAFWYGDERNGKNDIQDMFSYCKLTKAKLFGAIRFYKEKCYKIQATENTRIRKEPKANADVVKWYEKGKKAYIYAEMGKYGKTKSGWVYLPHTKKVK